MENINKIWGTCSTLVDEVGKAVIGKSNVLKYVIAGILSNGHILFEDFPGLAKTMMARTFAKTLGCRFKRVQFTPDVLPADIIGTYIFDEKESEFKLRQGPIFTNILLADEINRAPPKTQSALLEAMQETQVTIDGITHILPKPFMVFATQNPIEYEGTYPLPEAQIDRFLMKLSIGYPSRGDEKEILRRRVKREKDEVDINTIANPETVIKMQKAVEKVHIDDSLQDYIVEVVSRTRKDSRVFLGASPRGSLALFKISRALALLSNRDYVSPDDVKSSVIPGLAHRLILKPEVTVRGIGPEDILNKILLEVPVPAL
ncbi:MAG: MoxR family ATPase [Candidatus Thermoplasmatota archaeon]|nr:MoxR family ATPase [Candidatus Thermoplasmatota archaeon]